MLGGQNGALYAGCVQGYGTTSIYSSSILAILPSKISQNTIKQWTLHGQTIIYYNQEPEQVSLESKEMTELSLSMQTGIEMLNSQLKIRVSSGRKVNGLWKSLKVYRNVLFPYL